MSTVVNNNAQANGPTTVTALATAGVTWNLTALQVSSATPSGTGKLNIYDGTVATGTLIYSIFVGPPTLGSGGFVVDIPLPRDPYGRPSIQGTPGLAMTIQYLPAGTVATSVNARFSDGLP